MGEGTPAHFVIAAAACSSQSSGEILTPPDANAAAVAEPTTPPSGPDLDLFDVAGDIDFVTPFDERAPAPAEAQPSYVVRSYADPAAFGEMLAQAEAVAGPDQAIVAADLSGCILLTGWALPEPAAVLLDTSSTRRSTVPRQSAIEPSSSSMESEATPRANGATPSSRSMWSLSASPPTDGHVLQGFRPAVHIRMGQ